MNDDDRQLELDFGREECLADHPRTLKEVAAYYGVDQRIVRGWLQRNGLSHLARRRGSGSGYYYTVAELRSMAEALGD